MLIKAVFGELISYRKSILWPIVFPILMVRMF